MGSSSTGAVFAGSQPKPPDQQVSRAAPRSTAPTSGPPSQEKTHVRVSICSGTSTPSTPRADGPLVLPPGGSPSAHAPVLRNCRGSPLGDTSAAQTLTPWAPALLAPCGEHVPDLGGCQTFAGSYTGATSPSSEAPRLAPPLRQWADEEQTHPLRWVRPRATLGDRGSQPVLRQWPRPIFFSEVLIRSRWFPIILRRESADQRAADVYGGLVG
jgi:hypothetical protein